MIFPNLTAQQHLCETVEWSVTDRGTQCRDRALTMTTGSDAELSHDELAALKHVALAGAFDSPVEVTTDELADRLDDSRETVRRSLRRLGDAGCLVRRDDDGGSEEGRRLRVTHDGRTALAREYVDYYRLFGSARPLRLAGDVTEGVGEASEFVSLPGYVEQFRDRLGYEPFHGTLNVVVDDESEADSHRLAARDGVRIDGWEADGRTYGGVTCYPARVETADGREYDPAHVLVPDRTHHDASELEVLAPDRLRDELDLGDGDGVTVLVPE